MSAKGHPRVAFLLSVTDKLPARLSHHDKKLRNINDSLLLYRRLAARYQACDIIERLKFNGSLAPFP